jgi:hypothetical protein
VRSAAHAPSPTLRLVWCSLGNIHLHRPRPFPNPSFALASLPQGGYLNGEGFIDSAIGGVDDNAAWTSFMQNRWADWVLNGPPGDGDEPRDELHGMLRRREEDPPFPAKRNWIGKIKTLLKEADHPFTLDEAEGGAVSVGIRGDLTVADAAFLKDLASALVVDFVQVAFDGKLLGAERESELVESLHDEVDRIVGGAIELESKEEVTSTPHMSGSAPHGQLGYADPARR